MKFGAKTDIGRLREKNEDSYSIVFGHSDIPVAFIIADGMGGHNSGEVASKTAVDFIANYITNNPEIFADETTVTASIKEVIEKANLEVYNSANIDRSNLGMGTTLILAVPCGNKLYIGHIGDSRVYLVRNNEIIRITTDHSFVEELVKSGTLSREEAENHPQKNIITRALGCAEDIKVDIINCNIYEKDIFVLCTDGLTNMLSDEEILEVTLNSKHPEDACEELVRRANENGGIDNITVIVLEND